MNGSGLIQYYINREKKQIGLDVSGYDYNNTCFRNDASILLLVANSYARSTFELLKKIDECFVAGAQPEVIIQFVIPFMFNARHYIELEFKGLIMVLEPQKKYKTHKICNLMNDFEKALKAQKYSRVDKRFVKEADFNCGLSEAIKAYYLAKSCIDKFLGDESAVEYYRYIFEKDYSLKNPRIDFDYNEYSQLYKDLYQNMKKIIKELHCIGITIFDP